MPDYKCCLRGAYGPGNLGDDLLMLVSLRILEGFFKKEEICITVYDKKMAESFLPHYNFIPYSRPISTHLTFLGGGGQYFSFKKSQYAHGTWLSYLHVLKKHHKSGLSLGGLTSLFFWRVFKKQRWESKKNVAFCLGVGPFEEKTKLFKFAASEIPAFDYFSVRDVDSEHEVTKLGPKCDVSVFSDPIFNSDLWLGPLEIEPGEKKSNEVAIIIRDWPYGNNSICSIFLNINKSLNNLGFKAKFISFYENYDENVISELKSNGFDVVCWNPDKISLEDFLTYLSRFRFVITSRAHGAIVSSVLGVSCVILNFEKKLEKVHRMLVKSSLLVNLEDCYDENKLNRSIYDFYESLEGYESWLEHDVAKNKAIAKLAVEDVSCYLKRSIQ